VGQPILAGVPSGDRLSGGFSPLTICPSISWTLLRMPRANPHFSRASVGFDVAQALMPAASPLMGTLLLRHRVTPATRVEASLDTAATSGCATPAGGVAEMCVIFAAYVRLRA
jgi:hypothetical protein